ncbi:unnamed protein product [Chrysoparadoxa australica]
MSLRQTQFVASADGVPMLKIVGHPSGRIFMAGKDGNLYELEYDTVQGVLATYLGIGRGSGQRHCTKVCMSSSAAASLLPAFVTGSSLWGGDRSLVDLTVDPMRCILYCLDSKGCMDMYDLGANGDQSVHRVSRWCLWTAARDFSSRASRWGNGAHDVPEPRTFAAGHGFKVTAIQVVPAGESASVHLVAISNTGYRFYLSSGMVAPGTSSSAYSSAGKGKRPDHLSLLHIRAPPPKALWDFFREEEAVSAGGVGGQGKQQPREGFSPGTRDKTSGQVHTAYYCHGLTVMAEGKYDDPDSLMVIGSDYSNRGPTADGSKEVRPSLREGVCAVGSRVSVDAARPTLRGKVWAIAEVPTLLHNPAMSHLASLLMASKTPADQDISIQSKGSSLGTKKGGLFAKRTGDETTKAHAVPPSPPVCLAPAGSRWETGLTAADMALIAPLSELATQHASGQRILLCLTNAGLHTLARQRPVDLLYSLLLHERHQELPRFFDEYGKEQAVAMCFAIACGLPEGLGVSSGAVGMRQDVSRRAMHSLLCHGGTPSISSGQQAQGQGGERRVFMDEFSFSYHHNGLVLFLSRLLRPIWFQPVVVATGKPVSGAKRAANGASKDEPRGQVEVRMVLDRSELRALYLPLKELQERMKEYYKGAVSRGLSGEVVASEPVAGNMMSRVMQIYSTQDGRGYQRAREEDARRREEQSLHQLYRLVSRGVQALALINMLSDVKERQPHAVLQWERLVGLSFAALITSQDAHWRVNHLLTSLVQPGSGIDGALADQYSNELSRNCYFYFSEGDRLTYEGSKLLRKALTGGDSSADVERGISLLTGAASFWRSEAAIADGGCLRTACRELCLLGHEEAVVDVCLICAKSFQSPQEGGSKTQGVHGAPGSDWEVGLYHGGVITTDEGRLKARMTCYEVVLKTLERLLQPEMRVGAGPVDKASGTQRIGAEEWSTKTDNMIGRALRSEDEMFHKTLYDFLIERDVQRLVRIRSSYIEQYLSSRDHFLLYKHYSMHGQFVQAARLMDSLAHSPENTTLEERLQHFTRAISSAKNCGSGGFSGDKLVLLEDEMEVALLQKRVKDKLLGSLPGLRAIKESGRGGPGLDEEIKDRTQAIEDLEVKLVNISDLYNEYAQRFNLWQLCLSILHCCNRELPDLVKTLWRNIIYREVPSQSHNTQVAEWLARQRDGVQEDEAAPLIDSRDPNATFEEEGWISGLKGKIEALGKELYGTGADFVFPVAMLCTEMEGIACRHARTRSDKGIGMKHWVLDALLQAGVPNLALLGAYISAFHDSERREASQQLHILSELCTLLDRWTEEAFGAAPDLPKQQQLILANRNGELERRIVDLKSHLQALHGHGVDPTETDACVEMLRRVEQQFGRAMRGL